MMKTKKFLKSGSIFFLLSMLIPSCTVYNFYEKDEVDDSDPGNVDPVDPTPTPSEYVPTENEIANKDKYHLRTYKSFLKNPNFEYGIKVQKRRSSLLDSYSPTYRYDDSLNQYIPYSYSNDLTSNEHIFYDENGYLLFNKEEESLMDSYFDDTFPYLDYQSNPGYYLSNNEYKKIEPSDYYPHYLVKDGIAPLPHNGRSYSCTNNLVNDTWYLSEWWRPDASSLLFNGSYSDENDIYTYETRSRKLEIDKNNNSLRMVLDSGEEFGMRNDDAVDSANHVLIKQDKWPHFLIEQLYLDTTAKMSECNSIYIDFDFTLNSCEYTGLIPQNRIIAEEGNESYRNAAQIYLYISVADIRQFEADGSVKAMWIGMPLFDSRYNLIPRELNIDEGFVGATNRIIYKASNAEFFEGIDRDSGIQYGKKYHVNYDILPLIKNAFEYAANYNSDSPVSFAGRSWDDLVVYYLNYGYELPGAFKLDSTIANLDVYRD